MADGGLPDGAVGGIRQVLAASPEVAEAILYGSRAKGTHRPGSDVDLTLVGERLNRVVVNRIARALDDLLLPYTFDLSVLCQIDNPDLVEHIERVGVVFYRKAAE
jgi:predicted nucleotidyltransferase